MQAANANVKFADPKERGYTLLDVSPERMTADLVAMETVFERGCKRRVLKSFVIEAGKPGVTPG
jgi:phosphodiesterase/alkaline phosphatase D-like protein